MARRAAWHGGWLQGAARVPSPNFDARPPGCAVRLVVLHAISLPPGVFGGDDVERLFTNALDPGAHPVYAGLRGLRVSAHFFIRRSGRVLQFVACDQRAWHAGVSQWRGADRCNDYSIGIELEGVDGGRFETAQYAALVRLLPALHHRWSAAVAVGHEHVAPGRKQDPGAGFDWARLRALLRGRGPALPFACKTAQRRQTP